MRAEAQAYIFQALYCLVLAIRILEALPPHARLGMGMQCQRRRIRRCVGHIDYLYGVVAAMREKDKREI